MPPRSSFFQALLVALSAFFLYAHTFSYPLQFDDRTTIQENGLLRDLKNIPAFFTSPRIDSRDSFGGSWRPLPMTTFALNYAAGGDNPFGYRLFNALLHIANAVLVFVLLRRLGANLGAPFDSTWFSLFGGLAFALHPLQTQAVLLVWKRTGLMSAGFILLSLWFFARASTFTSAVGALICQLLGLLCKEDAAIAPLLFATCLAIRGGDGFKSRRAWKVVGASAFISIVYAMVWRSLIITRGAFTVPSVSSVGADSSYVATQAVIFWNYLRLLIWPFGQAADHLPGEFRFMDLLCVLSLLSLFVGAVAAVRCRKSRPWLPAGLLLLVIPLLPPLAARLLIPMDEARLYLPMIGFWLLAYGLLGTLLTIKKHQLFPALLSCLLVVWSGIAFARTRVWRDGRNLWADTLRVYPESVRALTNLSEAYLLSKQPSEALSFARRAVELAPRSPSARLNLAQALDLLGQSKDAEREYRNVVAMNPGSTHAHNNLGALLADQRRWDESKLEFERALKADPNFLPAYNNLRRLDAVKPSP